jgi:hypothetical protein
MSASVILFRRSGLRHSSINSCRLSGKSRRRVCRSPRPLKTSRKVESGRSGITKGFGFGFISSSLRRSSSSQVILIALTPGARQNCRKLVAPDIRMSVRSGRSSSRGSFGEGSGSGMLKGGSGGFGGFPPPYRRPATRVAGAGFVRSWLGIIRARVSGPSRVQRRVR